MDPPIASANPRADESDSAIEPISKRMRTETVDSNHVSQTAVQITDVVDEVLCAICMGSDGDNIKLLKSHNCPVCVVGAWRVCDVCDDNLLSRSCPVCNSDYSPRVLYVAPGMPIFPIPPSDMTDPKLILKLCAIGKLVSGSNVVVWCPLEKRMHFFLPQEFTDNSNDFRSLSVVILMTQDRIVNDQFLFDNKIWDELLREMEDESNNSDEILSSKDTMKKIFTSLNCKGSQLLTQLKPDEWTVFDE